MRNIRARRRRAISPIIATVLIVAVTLVASVAISGFVFGIFSTQSNSAQVAVTTATLRAVDFVTTGTSTSFVCSGTLASSVTLHNRGPAGTAVTSVTITWAGKNNAFSVSGCSVVAAGANPASLNLGVSGVSGSGQGKMLIDATTGGTYTGTVTLSNGAVLLFIGTFQ